MDDSTAKFGMFFLKAPANSADLLPNDDLVRQMREQGEGGQSHVAPRSGLLGMIDEVRRLAVPFVPGGQAAEINPDALDPPDDDVLELDRFILVDPDDPPNPDKRSNQPGDTGMSDDNKPAFPVSGGGGQPTLAGSPPPGVPHVQSAPSVGGAGNVPPVPTFATTRPVAPDAASAPNTPVTVASSKKTLWWFNLKRWDWWLGGLVVLALLVAVWLVTFIIKNDLLGMPRSTAFSMPMGDPVLAARALHGAVAPTAQRVDGLERRVGEQGNTITAQQAQIDELKRRLAQAQSQASTSNTSADFWAKVLKELQRMQAEDRARIPQS